MNWWQSCRRNPLTIRTTQRTSPHESGIYGPSQGLLVVALTIYETPATSSRGGVFSEARAQFCLMLCCSCLQSGRNADDDGDDDDRLSNDLRVSNQTRRDKTQLIVYASVDYGHFERFTGGCVSAEQVGRRMCSSTLSTSSS